MTTPTPLNEVLATQSGEGSWQGADGTRAQFTTPFYPDLQAAVARDAEWAKNPTLAPADAIDAVLATQGEQLDRAKILEDMTLPTPLPTPSVAVVEEAKKFAADVVYPQAVPTVDVATREEYVELKAGINDSFGEIAGILLDLQARFERLDERIEQFNRRGGHKF